MVFSMSQTMPKNGKIRHNRQTLFLCCCTQRNSIIVQKILLLKKSFISFLRVVSDLY